jgi:hypothetical protein
MDKNLTSWMRKNKKRFDNPFDLAVACTCAFSLWGKNNQQEVDIPSRVIKVVEKVWR